MDTPTFSAALQVGLGGVLVFLTGVLIGSSYASINFREPGLSEFLLVAGPRKVLLALGAGFERLPAVKSRFSRSPARVPSLAGIVVRNSIVLLEFILDKKQEGMPIEQALIDAMRVVIATQEQAGIDVVCDGELYRFDINHPETNGMIEYFVRPMAGVQSIPRNPSAAVAACAVQGDD